MCEGTEGGAESWNTFTCKDSVLLDPLTPMLIGGSGLWGGGGANNVNGTFYGYYGITDHTQGKLAGTT